LRYLEPPALLLISSGVACLVLFTILLVQGKIILLRILTLKNLALSAFLGFLNPFLYYLVLLKAYDMLRAQEAGTLNYVWPLVLVLLSIPMLRQKISLGSIVAIMISFAGIAVISIHPDGLAGSTGAADPAGVVLAIGSAILWALYWIFNLRDHRETVSKLFVNFSFGFLYTLILVFATGQFQVHGWQGAAGGIYIGLFEMGFTFVLWLNALNYSTTTAKVSNLIYLSPFISLIFIHFTVGETIFPSTVAGLVLIITGIGLQQYLKH
jgi:drug/metabolite transporter (DMT)-like permease